MHLPDPELVLDRGLKAQELMNSPAFQSVVDDLSHYHLAALVAAPPGERGREAREHHHLMHHAITQICADIQSRIDAALEVQRRIAEAEEDAE